MSLIARGGINSWGDLISSIALLLFLYSYYESSRLKRPEDGALTQREHTEKLRHLTALRWGAFGLFTVAVILESAVKKL